MGGGQVAPKPLTPAEPLKGISIKQRAWFPPGELPILCAVVFLAPSLHALDDEVIDGMKIRFYWYDWESSGSPKDSSVQGESHALTRRKTSPQLVCLPSNAVTIRHRRIGDGAESIRLHNLFRRN